MVQVQERDVIPSKAVLMVVTSCREIESIGPTGVSFEEFAHPFIYFRHQAYLVVVASPQGGEVLIDPKSQGLEEDAELPLVDQLAQDELRNTRKLDSKLTASVFDAVYFPGGHGALYDLPGDSRVQRIVHSFVEQNKMVAAVGQGAAALVDSSFADAPVVKGKKMAVLSNVEEAAMGMQDAVPFSLEDRLRECGAEVVVAPPEQEHVIADDWLITGQNTQSAALVAVKMVEILGRVELSK